MADFKKPVRRGKSLVNPKHDGRHWSVVGGTNSQPSLREVRHHRNQRAAPKRSHSAKPGLAPETGPMVNRGSSSNKNVAPRTTSCDFCTKVQRHYDESDGLRKKTLFSDVTLHASDGDYFYGNSFVLAVWSKVLLDKAQCMRGQTGEEEWIVFLDVRSGEILQSALRYMYGGSMVDLPPQHLPEIVKMAETYQMEELKRSCFEAAKTVSLRNNNACAVWTFADHFGLPEASERAMRFIYGNLEKVSADRDWERVKHRPEMLLKLFEATVGWTMPNADWRSWKLEGDAVNTVATGVQNVFKESADLRNPYAYSDTIIVAKDKSIFHVHTQVIYTSAPAFANFLHEETDLHDSVEVSMDDFDADVVEEFLRFIYRQDPSPAFPKLAQVVYILADTYEVRELKGMCEREMAAQQLTSVEAALEMLKESEEHRMGTAKSVCFRYLYGHLDDVRQHPKWREMIAAEPQLLTEMMLESKRFRRLIPQEE